MGNVPNILHFIAPVEPFNNGELTNILSWATSNLCYSLKLWCADGYVDDIKIRLVEVATFLPEITAAVPEVINMQTTVYLETVEGAQTISICSIRSIKPLCPWEVLFIEYTVFKRKQVVRQIASFWVLHAEGGVFIDIDIPPPPLPLPQSLEAPEGILLALYTGAAPQFVTSVMAAPPSGFPVITLHNAHYRHYKGHFIFDEAGNPNLSEDVREQFFVMEKQKEGYRNLASRAEMRPLTRHEQRYQHWLDEQVGLLEKELRLRSIPSPIIPYWFRKVLGIFSTANVPEEKRLLPPKRRDYYKQLTAEETGMLMNYAFQMQTGCELIIPRTAIGDYSLPDASEDERKMRLLMSRYS